MNKEHIEELLARIKEGDKSELKTIYLENRNAFLNFGLKFGLSNDAVLEVYQDVIIAFIDNVKNGKITTLNSSVKTYLFSIGKFIIYKQFQKKQDNILPLDVERLKNYLNEIDDNEIELTNNFKTKLVEQGLSKLGKQCKKVLKLFYYNGLTLAEIQEYLNYENYNTIKSQKSRCLKNLKELINEELNNG